MRIVTVRLAEFASVASDGKLTLLNVFGAISPAAVPYLHPQLFVWALIDASDEDPLPEQVGLQLEVIGPGDTPMISLGPAVSPVNIPPIVVAKEIDLLFGIGGLVFPEYGRYQFRVSIPGRPDVVPLVRELFVQAPPAPVAG